MHVSHSKAKLTFAGMASIVDCPIAWEATQIVMYTSVAERYAVRMQVVNAAMVRLVAESAKKKPSRLRHII